MINLILLRKEGGRMKIIRHPPDNHHYFNQWGTDYWTFSWYLVLKNIKLSYRIIRNAVKQIIFTWFECNCYEHCDLCGIAYEVAISVDTNTWLKNYPKNGKLCINCYSRLCYENNSDMNIKHIYCWDGCFNLVKEIEVND